MRAATLLFAALACTAACSGARAAPAGAYEQLAGLAGEWEADLPGFGKLTNSIRPMSNGKALEETIGTPADNETSIYTRDGEQVLLTHFCALTPPGHIARLALQPQLYTVFPQLARANIQFKIVETESPFTWCGGGHNKSAIMGKPITLPAT